MLIVLPAMSSKTKRFGRSWIFPSKTSPPTSALALMTGLQEFPPMMSFVDTKSKGGRQVRSTLGGYPAGGKSPGPLMVEFRRPGEEPVEGRLVRCVRSGHGIAFQDPVGDLQLDPVDWSSFILVRASKASQSPAETSRSPKGYRPGFRRWPGKPPGRSGGACGKGGRVGVVTALMPRGSPTVRIPATRVPGGLGSETALPSWPTGLIRPHWARGVLISGRGEGPLFRCDRRERR